jgi:uncharacterized protein YbaR (Trm112 family)
MICPKCKHNAIVNSVPISDVVACHNCRRFYRLVEVEPVKLGGTKVHINLQIKKGE